MYNVTVIAVMM